MKVFIQKDRAMISFKYSGTVKQLLDRMNISPETVMVTQNGKLVREDEMLSDKDDVKVLQVVSGG
jgi:sulfur carrier protein ThiS